MTFFLQHYIDLNINYVKQKEAKYGQEGYLQMAGSIKSDYIPMSQDNSLGSEPCETSDGYIPEQASEYDDRSRKQAKDSTTAVKPMAKLGHYNETTNGPTRYSPKNHSKHAKNSLKLNNNNKLYNGGDAHTPEGGLGNFKKDDSPSPLDPFLPSGSSELANNGVALRPKPTYSANNSSNSMNSVPSDYIDNDLKPPNYDSVIFDLQSAEEPQMVDTRV